MLAVAGHGVDLQAAGRGRRPPARLDADLQRLEVDLGHVDVGRGLEVGAVRAWRGSGPRSSAAPGASPSRKPPMAKTISSFCGFHSAAAVRSAFVPSLYWPMSFSRAVVPTANSTRRAAR